MLNLENTTIGFIGFGNMAQAVAYGLIRQGTLQGSQMYACAKNFEKLCSNTEDFGIHPCKTAEETAKASQIIFIAVKPYLVEEVLMPIREILRDKILVSVAVNMGFETYENILLPGTHHLSTLPNTPVSVGEGVFICEETHSLDKEEFVLVESLLSTISMVQIVPSKLMGIAGTITGCGPAFASMFIEALGDAGVQHGLPRQLAYELAGQMIAGTGKLLIESGKHPGAMKDAVCSPGGTTIVGVTTLERKGFRSAVIDAVDAIEKK